MPSSSISKDLKDATLQINFKIKNFSKSTKTYGGNIIYLGSIYFGDYRLGRIAVEARNVEEVKLEVKKSILKLINKYF